MNDLRAAAEQALECLKGVARGKYDGNAAGVCATLEAALAQQAEPVEPVAWVHTDAYNPKVRFLEWTQQPKGYLGDWIKTPLCNCAQPRQSDPQIEDRLARHGIPKP
jgi:hypothetical protein